MGNNAIDFWMTVAMASLLAIVGVVALIAATRQRRGTLRVCRGCEYPIDQLDAATTRCPECGGDLSRPGAVAIGKRRRNVMLFVAGIALLVPLTGGTAWVAMRAAKSPAAIAPVAVVATPTFARFVPTPLPDIDAYDQLTGDQLADAILVEQSREQLASLLLAAAERAAPRTSTSQPTGDSKWVDRLVAYAVALQRDESRPFPDEWATFAERVLQRRSFDGWREYLQRGLQFDVKMRRTVHLGSPFPLGVTTRLRISAALAKQLECRQLSLTFGDRIIDEPLRTDPRPADKYGLHMDGKAITWPLGFLSRSKDPIALGEQKATLSIYVKTMHPAYDWIARIDRMVTVQPRRAINPSPPSDPAIDDLIGRRLRITADPNGINGDGLTWDGKSARLALTLVDSPTDICAEVSVGIGTAGYHFGLAHWAKGESATRTFSISANAFKDVVGKDLSVFVIGSPLNADASFEEADWWTGTVKFDGVTLLDPRSTVTTKPSTPRPLAYEPSERRVQRSEPYRPIPSE